ncbi:hypothetical protein AVEN_180452-1 [Araneus ventricosus]|uniref:Uncharacterized protein n=1 Tax=Araneus ventricosus TaxID=182803 RepID=A0A4Y2GKB3_ARAVE|nr:hypothetical protein AVEN_180452-1 [Araneus ventricosus]
MVQTPKPSQDVSRHELAGSQDLTNHKRALPPLTVLVLMSWILLITVAQTVFSQHLLTEKTVGLPGLRETNCIFFRHRKLRLMEMKTAHEIAVKVQVGSLEPPLYSPDSVPNLGPKHSSETRFSPESDVKTVVENWLNGQDEISANPG